MKTKNYILSLILMMGLLAVKACSKGIGDSRDKHLEQATIARIDSVTDIQYVGMSDAHELEDNKFQAVVIYYITDSVGNRTEHNARVTTNGDCSEIYYWEELDTSVVSEVKHKVNDKMKEKGIDLNGSLIDALIELKKR